MRCGASAEGRHLARIPMRHKPMPSCIRSATGASNPTTPLNRLKRVLGYLALAVVLVMVLWFTVIWLTHEF